jgi:hypothetical protein
MPTPSTAPSPPLINTTTSLLALAIEFGCEYAFVGLTNTSAPLRHPPAMAISCPRGLLFRYLILHWG